MLLVAGVHEGAGGALGAEIWIVDGRAGVFGVAATGKLGVGVEAGRAAVELAGMGEDHSGAAVHGLDDASDLDVEIAIFAEFADLVVIFPWADDGEAAVVVGGLRRANVEESSAVGKLHDVIDMRRNANVFVEHFGGLIGGEAGLGCGVGEKRRKRGQKGEVTESAQGHLDSFRGMKEC